MSIFTRRVIRRRRLWAVWTTISTMIMVLVAVLIALYVHDLVRAYGASDLLVRLTVGAFGIWALGCVLVGQVAQSLMRQSWDVWIADLDATEVQMLIEQLKRHSRDLEDEDDERSS